MDSFPLEVSIMCGHCILHSTLPSLLPSVTPPKLIKKKQTISCIGHVSRQASDKS